MWHDHFSSISCRIISDYFLTSQIRFKNYLIVQWPLKNLTIEFLKCQIIFIISKNSPTFYDWHTSKINQLQLDWLPQKSRLTSLRMEIKKYRNKNACVKACNQLAMLRMMTKVIVYKGSHFHWHFYCIHFVLYSSAVLEKIL